MYIKACVSPHSPCVGLSPRRVLPMFAACLLTLWLAGLHLIFCSWITPPALLPAFLYFGLSIKLDLSLLTCPPRCSVFRSSFESLENWTVKVVSRSFSPEIQNIINFFYNYEIVMTTWQQTSASQAPNKSGGSCF